ncbi:MAG: phenylalanine--tRNA ligase subunit beta, partial [Pseudomonadota bacterium]|nr:phenylalanine--tRNA ligase subunit beta [Pseudomonadota bacterium]
MKLSRHWLDQVVDSRQNDADLSHLLTMGGLEVEGIEPVAPPFARVVVAQVLSCEPHPQADRLKLCTVQAEAGASALQIVCGAPNVAVGLKVPCALVGATLPGIEIREAKVRGIVSHGMLCSAKELGISEESDGLLVLPDDAPVGTSIRDYLDLDDRVFELKLTPNRGDCLSLKGLAREVAAITQAPLHMPAIEAVPATLAAPAGAA